MYTLGFNKQDGIYLRELIMNSELKKEGINYLKEVNLFDCNEDALKMVFKLYRKINNIKTRKKITFTNGDFENEFVIDEDIYSSYIYSGSDNILVFNLVHTEKTTDRESTISTILSDDEVCEFDPSFN
jgi:hypothetical protein